MAEVVIEEGGDGSFAVEVRTPEASSRYSVIVPQGFPEEIGCADVATADLVRASFAFLLEREPATSILRRFRLDEISSYFPEYPEAIRRYVD